MAEKLVSPGVFTRENDLSYIAQGVGAIGGAIVGPFKQGPAFKPTIVTSPSELEDIFGKADGTYYTELTAQNYLRETGLVTVARVGGIGGYEDDKATLIFASSSLGTKLVGVLHGSSTGAFTGSTFSDEESGSFSIDGRLASVYASSNESIDDVYGVSPLGTKGAYTYGYFKNAIGGTFNSLSSYVQTQSYTQDICGAETPIIQSQLISGERYDLFKFHTLSDGTVENTRFKITIGNIKAAGSVPGSDYGTFSVYVRDFNDTDKRQNILEQYNNVNLDPTSTNYIARVIGDGYSTIDSNGKVSEYGDWGNKSKYIRVAMAAGSDANPVVAVPFGHEAYTIPFTTDGDDSLVPVVDYATGSTSVYAGFDFTNSDNLNYLKPISDLAGAGDNVAFGLDVQGGLV